MNLSYRWDKFKTEKPTWDLDDEHLDNMKSLGLI